MRYVAVPDEDALAAFRRLAELEGIIPALEPAHALAWLLANPDPGLSLVTLSGRGDKDLAEVLGAKPPRHVPAWLARLVAGEHGVTMMTELRGISNAKAKRELGWEPSRPSWRVGFRELAPAR